MTRAGDRLLVAPCLPDDWNAFSLSYRYRDTLYRIAVTRFNGSGPQAGVMVDGVWQADGAIPLVDDRRDHAVTVAVAASPAACAR